MKIKLDENVPGRLVELLSSLGHDVDTVHAEGLAGKSDDLVWLGAQQAGRFLITQDLDFSDVRQFRPGMHAGLLLVRLRDPGRQTLLARIGSLFQSEPVEEWSGCFVVATEHKLRVRHP